MLQPLHGWLLQQVTWLGCSHRCCCLLLQCRHGTQQQPPHLGRSRLSSHPAALLPHCLGPLVYWLSPGLHPEAWPVLTGEAAG
jgi:hypothetical protein